MTGTRVAVLTPPGTGAIATLAVVGPQAWDVVRGRFRPANGKPLPDSPSPHQFWYGSLGDGPGDEVVVAVQDHDPPWVEVHCHGGRRVVRWLIEQFTQGGCVEVGWQHLTKPRDGRPWALEPLTHAPTLRTASILLDQYHGAFAQALSSILAKLDAGDPAAANHLAALVKFADVGRHLVAPWKVAVAGPPNVGKSSLINALAGYQRSIVTPVAGTTRDVVTVPVALDGWPIELSDTAGRRDTAEPLEAEGVRRATAATAAADLVLWVIDCTDPLWPGHDLSTEPLVVVNKTDLPHEWDRDNSPPAVHVSAATGAGIPDLTAAIVAALVPESPAPGAAVPYTPVLADAVEAARRSLTAGQPDAARETLAGLLPRP